jgi:quaternary ammonium compound-resistance protein SugE
MCTSANRRKKLLLQICTVLLSGLCYCTIAHAQLKAINEEPAKQVHWAMGAFFGTGWYQVDENRTVYVFRIPPRQTVRESSFDEGGKRKLGVEILYPLSIGLHNLDEIPDFIDFDNFGTISFTPGVQVEIPVTQKWYLRPYAHIGYGVETSTSDSAWIYYGGLKSRYRLGSGRVDWSLLNGINFAGYKPEFDNRGRYAKLTVRQNATAALANVRRTTSAERVTMSWVYLIVAGMFEIGWPLGLKYAQGAEHRLAGIVLAIVSMAISGGLLFVAQKQIAMGTAYAVWTGIGAAGTFLVGIWLFGDAASLSRYLGVALIIAGVVTLKFAH